MSWSIILSIIVSSLLTSGIFALILKAVLPSILQSAMKLWFDKKLENHKHELSQLLEGTRFNFSRLMNDYSTFNQKRHETYAELYRLLLVAQGYLARYGTRLVERYEYNEYNEPGIRSLLKEMEFPDGTINEICANWDTDKKYAHTKIYERQDQMTLSDTRKVIREFHNQYLSRELYLSREVAVGFEEIDKAVNEGEVYAKSYIEAFRYQYISSEIISWRSATIEGMDKTLKEIERLKTNLKSLMLKELQQGTTEI